MLGDRRYCYPLTITDFASRYLLTCEALSTTQEKFAFTVFERTFKEFGLPHAIQTDNGVPSPQSLLAMAVPRRIRLLRTTGDARTHSEPGSRLHGQPDKREGGRRSDGRRGDTRGGECLRSTAERIAVELK
jgi:hypothetical protein